MYSVYKLLVTVLLQAVKTWASRYMRGKLRRLGVEDADVDGAELGEVSTAVNPYLFLARHGMAVAGAGASGAKKLRPATTAESNGASTANATSAVPESDDHEHSKSIVE